MIIFQKTTVGGSLIRSASAQINNVRNFFSPQVKNSLQIFMRPNRGKFPWEFLESPNTVHVRRAHVMKREVRI